MSEVSEVNECGCGRSPTGKCIGWHALSEEDFRAKLKAFEEKKKNKNQVGCNLYYLPEDRLN